MPHPEATPRYGNRTMRYRLFLLLLMTPCLALPVQAGIFGRKKDKIDPKIVVPELITTLKSDRDADKRARAAAELRNHDVASFPDILPALVEALLQDPKPNVRAEAAQSLGKIRPVSQVAGEALEQATANDSSMRVRLNARSALLQYHWAGYRSGNKGEAPPLTSNSKEPPVINTRKPGTEPPALRPVPSKIPPASTVPTALTPPVPSTKEPPLAAPLPSAPTLPPPSSGSSDTGPELP